MFFGENTRSNLKKTDENETVLECLYPVRDGYEDVFKLFCAIETFPCSTAISESSFSSLGRIGILGRVHMTNERLRNLTMLAFGSRHLKAIPTEKILRKFNDGKKRRLQIF